MWSIFLFYIALFDALVCFGDSMKCHSKKTQAGKMNFVTRTAFDIDWSIQNINSVELKRRHISY